MTADRAATTTILFSDLVNSTELIQRAGDEDAQRIFKAHYQLLRDAVASNGGAEVKSLGDGLMVAFPSAADAVRCAIAMQQMSRRPVEGQRLTIRIGLNAGDALRDEGDYFGTMVVTARRLCDRAGPGQILCSATVEGLLAGRQAFSFLPVGDLELKGIPSPVATREVAYQADEPGAFLTYTPFIGRGTELERLQSKLRDALAGHGGLVMLVGEPGIGKTRLTEEFAETASAGGTHVLRGQCYEGEWAPPYGPFVEAIKAYANAITAEALREDLGAGAATIARLVPGLRDHLPDVSEPEPLQPDEARFRLLDAVAQLLTAISRRTPLLLVLDDLHWVDRGTIAMLRHVARSAPKQRLLILGAYRDVELDRQHPLADALAALRRETEYERIALKGLAPGDVGVLLETIAEQPVNAALVQAISEETDGNPFFIREVLLHLVEEGKLYRKDGRWQSSAASVAELGIPEGVRQVITRRLSRLSDNANRLLAAASAFSGGFSFEVVAEVPGLDEAAALDAVDEALTAELLRPAGDRDHYDFTHALIRHTLYGEMNPSRQVRLHRQIAETIERRDATSGRDSATVHGPELAYQYHRSAAMAGGDRGVPYALAAARQAEQAVAWQEAATFLRMALDLMPASDERRPRLLGRYAVALAWSLELDDATKVALEAGEAIAAREGERAAAEFFDDHAGLMGAAGSLRGVWRLAESGLKHAGQRRDGVWARLMFLDLQRRDAENPNSAGTMVSMDAPEYAELVATCDRLPVGEHPIPVPFPSRVEVLRFVETTDADTRLSARTFTGSTREFIAFALAFGAGEYRRARDMFLTIAAEDERLGKVSVAVGHYAYVARCHNALGDFVLAKEAYEHSLSLAARLGGDPLLGAQSIPVQQAVAAADEMRISGAIDVSGGTALAEGLLRQRNPELQWAHASVEAASGRLFATLGNGERALECVGWLARSVDRIPPWDRNLPRVLCDAAEALWVLDRTDGLEIFERNLQSKVLEPDFRYPMFDARHAMAKLCALTGRYDDAKGWFAKARTVLDEQGARPLRAIVDYDETLMYFRRGGDGDQKLAQPLLGAALAQFQDIGMSGWIERAQELRGRSVAP